MAQYYLMNKELDKINFNEELKKLNLNTNNYSFDIESIIRFSFDNYKQLLLLLLAFVIIIVVDHITHYNTLFYGLTSSVPGVTNTPQKISNTFKKNRKNRK
jgi:hypothetical protein